MRLAGGANQYEGRVEIYYGDWGTVCDDHWTLTEAEVVCRSLGSPGAKSATTSARYIYAVKWSALEGRKIFL